MFLDIYMVMHGHGAIVVQFYTIWHCRKFTIFNQGSHSAPYACTPHRYRSYYIASSVVPDSSLPATQESKLQDTDINVSSNRHSIIYLFQVK